MPVNVTYREAGAVVPGATTIKNSPLSNGEIDGNFKSVKDAVEVLSTTGGAGLVGIVSPAGMSAVTVQGAIAELDSEKASFTDLAATDGASKVGYDGGTVQDVLDGAVSLQSYTALRAYAGSATQIRITNNGISGFFYRNDTDTTTADNGGTVIVSANGKRWKRLFDGPVNVKWFGAKGDGVNNDTVLCQAAIDYSVSIGADLYTPSGVYMISASHGVNEVPGSRPGRGLFIDGPLRIKLEIGSEFKLIPSDFVDPTLLIIRNTENVIIDGGTWTGDRYTHLGTTGEGGGLIIATCCSNVLVRNAFGRFAWGDGLGAYSYPAKTVAESGLGYTSPPTVTITGGGGSGAVATAILGDGTYGTLGTVHRFNVTNQGLNYTTDPTVVLTGGGGSGATAKAIVSKDGKVVGITIVNSQICKNITFENCRAVKNGRNNLTIGAIDGLTVNNCLFEAADRIAPKFGIDIEPDGNQESARNILIENCTFKDNFVGGIALGGGNRCYRVTLRDCVFINNGVGFSVSNSYEISFVNNRIYGGALASSGGGGFTNSTRCSFTRNFIDLDNKSLLGLAGVIATASSSKITFDANIIRRCNRGISLNDGSGFIVINNNISDLGRQAIYQSGIITQSQFIGNNISANTEGDGTFFGQATNCMFSKNRFSDMYTDALYGNFTDCEITGNQFTNWSAILTNAAAILAINMNGCLVHGNYFKAGTGSNFAIEESNPPTAPSYVQQNYLAYTTTMNPLQKLKVGTICEDNHHSRYSAAPTTGTWLAGQRVYHSSPTAGGNIGWVCTVAGSPGTWKPFGTIGA